MRLTPSPRDKNHAICGTDPKKTTDGDSVAALSDVENEKLVDKLAVKGWGERDRKRPVLRDGLDEIGWAICARSIHNELINAAFSTRHEELHHALGHHFGDLAITGVRASMIRLDHELSYYTTCLIWDASPHCRPACDAYATTASRWRNGMMCCFLDRQWCVALNQRSRMIGK